MKYVLDANVALKWVLRERDSDKSRQLLVDYHQQIHDLLAPDIFPIEVAHALSRSERRGIITPAQGPIFLAGILASRKTHTVQRWVSRALPLNRHEPPRPGVVLGRECRGR